jgi:hypothetical protein
MYSGIFEMPDQKYTVQTCSPPMYQNGIKMAIRAQSGLNLGRYGRVGG